MDDGYRHRRPRQAQGRPPLHHRQGPLHRRHQSSEQTYAYFVRCPHAHATIKSIDTAKAKKMPGVVGVFTGEDLADDKSAV